MEVHPPLGFPWAFQAQYRKRDCRLRAPIAFRFVHLRRGGPVGVPGVIAFGAHIALVEPQPLSIERHLVIGGMALIRLEKDDCDIVTR